MFTVYPWELKLRVIHVINSLGRGGAEAVLYRLVTSPSMVEHEIVCLDGRGAFSALLEASGIRVHHLRRNSAFSTPSTIWRLFWLIRESRADIVQTWMYRSNILAGLAGWLTLTPVVWNIRCSLNGPLRTASSLLAHLGGHLARWVPKTVINCSAESALLHARLGYDATEVTVIPNGYDTQASRPHAAARGRIRSGLGAGDETFLVGCIARWHAQKGFPDLLGAIGALAARGLPLRLALVGREMDADNQELGQLIHQAGCEGLVELFGERSDIPEIAHALDLHVLASVGSEGFPNAVAETMLMSTPNIATAIGDAALIIGETGWVIPPGEVKMLTSAIEEAYREWHAAPQRWKDRRESSRQRIVENFSLERMVGSYEKVWARVAARSDRKLR